MISQSISRRRLLGAAAAAAAASAGAGLFFAANPAAPRAVAQDTQAGPATPVPLGPAVPDEFSTATNWPAENYDYASTRDIMDTNISAATIGQLGDAWNAPIKVPGFFGALTAQPAIVGDALFVQDAAANVYAFDKTTGQQLWANTYNDKVPSGGPNGIAAGYGLLFTTLGGAGDVLALRQDSGEEVWRTNIRGPLNEGITTCPAVRDNIVYVSTIPGESEGFYGGGQRGVIHALDAGSGQVLWYFDTTTDNLWGQPTVNSGGGFWHPPSFDDDGKLYVGIGNPAPYPGAEGWPWGSSRPGANLYTNAILKMGPKDGTLDWYYQVKEGGLFDLDNQLSPILAELDGRPVVFTSGKHGFVVCLDRESGEVIWRVPVGTHQNDELRAGEIEPDARIEVWPGTLGGVETQFAYSQSANLLICPVYELPTTYIATGVDPDAGFNFTTATGLLIALNPADGSAVWQTELASGPLAAATICNDIVFSAGLDGVVQAFRVDDGSEVFRYQATAGINAPLAISGDYLYIPAGGPLIPSANTADPAPDVLQALIALKIGGSVQASPVPSPVAEDGATPVTGSTDGSLPTDSAVTPGDATPEAGG